MALAETTADFNALNPMNAPGMRKAMEKVKRMQDERNLKIQKLGRRKSKQQMEPPVRAFVKTVSSCRLQGSSLTVTLPLVNPLDQNPRQQLSIT
jgi:hypothetical protein